MQTTAQILPSQSSYADLQKENGELKLEVLTLKHQMQQMIKMVYGSRSDKFVPTGSSPSQLLLDIQTEQTATCSVVDAKKISYIRTTTQINETPITHQGRMKLPEHLRREEIII